MDTTLSSLQARWGQHPGVRFESTGALGPVLVLHTALAQARVALQGAQVLAWQPTGQQPVIWLSPTAVFEAGKSVRGGIPVCWPWFGPRAGAAAHGFARNTVWTLREVRTDAAGVCHITLGLSSSPATLALWPHPFDLTLTVSVGAALALALTTHNLGTQVMALTQALHTYFAVGELAQTRVLGLEGGRYLDKVRASALTLQDGAVVLQGEVDRVYIDTTADCVIDDAAQQRRIRIAKAGSTSTVVWNPGPERERTFADMLPGSYQHMLCVETTNAGPDEVSVAPGQSHTLRATYSLEV
jgi:glucose-6-phosphate 1-epimerase